MTIRIATVEDAADIASIYAPNVEGSGISFEDTAPDAAEMAARIEKILKTHPWLVMESGGRVVAYAYACLHRERAAYRWSCEVSVYVGERARRTGAARKLYKALFATLVRLGFANAYVGITLPNDPSIGFHEAMGFELVGIYRNVGFKAGTCRDVGWWGLELQELSNEPSDPLPFDKHPNLFSADA